MCVIARNKTMLKMFTMIDVGERAGSGVPNMFERWVSCGYSSPRLEESTDPEVSTVFLPLDNTEEKDLGTVLDGSGFSKNEQCAIDLAQENGRVTTKQLSETAAISKQAASALLKRLADRGVLRWHGNRICDPSQYYWMP